MNLRWFKLPASGERARSRLDALEPRILMSADPLGALADVSLADDGTASDADAVADLRSALEQHDLRETVVAPTYGAEAADERREEIVFVDAGTPDTDALIAALTGSTTERDLTVVVLDAQRDGLEQIDEWLSGSSGIDAVHLVGHGAAGGMQLGSTWLDADLLREREDLVAGWSGALAAEADLLLYGCDVAADETGRDFVQALARLTGADVAASADLTGSAALGGDWDLEVRVGEVEAALALAADGTSGWIGVLGAPAPAGTETLVNTTTTGTQSDVDIDHFNDGTYVTAWTTDSGIAFRRFDAAGAPLDANEVAVPSAVGATESAVAVATSNNRFVVVYESTVAADTDIYAAVYNADGSVDIAPFKVNSGTGYDVGNQTNPDVAVRNNGDFTVVWQGAGPDDGDGGIYYKSFQGNGNVDTAETLVNATTAGTQDSVSIAMDNQGDRLIAWRDTDGTDHIDAVFVDRSDNFSGYFAPGTATNAQTGPDVAAISNGNFVIAWQEDRGATGDDIFARRYQEDGTALSAAFQVNAVTADSQTGPRVSSDGGSSFVVAWETDNGTGDPGAGIAVREYSSTGVAQHSTETRVNTSTTGDQAVPAVSMTSATNFVVAWHGNGTQAGQVDGSGVFAQRFSGTTPNAAPTVALANTVTAQAENTSTATRIKVADIVVTDDGEGANDLTLTGTDAALFEIDGTELFIRAGTTLDFETNPSLDVTVNVDDVSVGATPDDTAALSVSVTDVNEAPTVSLANTVANLAENVDTTVRVSVADIVVADDALGTESLTLTGADAALFEIDANVLYLRAGTALDFETNPTLDVTVNVDDATLGGTPDDTAALAIAVTNVNEAPTVALANTVTNLAENTSTATRVKVADINVTDDALGTETLTLTGADAALFEIDGTELFIRAGATLDFETNPSLDVTVNVEDATVGDNPDDTASLAVSITDVNEAPTVALANTVTTLAEDVATGTRLRVADITVTDDALGAETLTLSGADAGLFEIDGTQLFLRAGTVLDFETNPSLDVTVQVDDATLGSTPDDTANLTVTITDANEAPTVALANTVTNLAENTSTAARIKVADIAITDDALGTETLALTGADAGAFEIDGTELFIRAGTALDFETNPSLDVTVTVDDATVGATPDDTANLTVALTDVNEAPSVALANTVTGISDTTSTAARVKVADIVVTDDALGAETLTLTGADAALFEIDGTELFIRAGTVLDAGANPVLDVTVNVDDATVGGTPDDTAALAITVTNSNAAPTVALANTVTNLPEDTSTAARVKVADINITDDGNGTNALSLTGADAALFEVDGTELFIRAGATLDFETNPTLDVTVNVDDPLVGGTPDDTAALSISLADRNDAPSVALANTVTNLAENASTAARVKVADINVTDDALGTESLSLTGTDAALFEIDGTELFIRAGTTLDFETNPSLDVTVNVDDATVGGTPDDTASLSVAIGDVNEAPTVTLANTVTNLAENASVAGRIKVADIVVADDALGTESLSLTGADAALFEVDGAELFIRAGTALDFETNPTLDVTVQVDDVTVGATPDDTAALAIAVTDVNEAPTVALANTVTNLAESTSTAARVKVADINVTDDALGTETLTLTGTDAASFEIVGTELFIRAGVTLDFETNPTLNVTVQVDDATVGATPDDTASLAVSVTDANEAPLVSTTNAVTSLPENQNTAARIRVAEIVVTDDALGTETLTLTGADAALFEIDGNGLFLRAGAALDFETNPSLDVTINVDDATIAGSPDNSTPFSLAITDVNERPSVALANTVTTLPESTVITARLKVADINITDDALGTEIITLTGSDSALFEVDGNELFIRAGTTLDFESNPTLSVIVRINDPTVGNNPDDTAALAITVTDVNEPPTVTLSNTVTAIAETASTVARIKVADINVTDDGLGTETLTLTGDDAALFEIDGGELFLRAGTVLDAGLNRSLDVDVAIDDATIGTTPDDSASLAITVTSLNNPPTVALTNTVTSLAENSADATRLKVADIAVTDDGNGVNTLGLAGADASSFEIDAGALWVRAGTTLDFESGTSLDVTVTVDDTTINGGIEDTATLSVTTTDVNEAPTVTLANVVGSLLETAAGGARVKVADIVISDDALGTETLGLTGADAGLFEIDGNELFLVAGTSLETIAPGSLNVTVTVDDVAIGTSAEATRSLTIEVQEIEEVEEVVISPAASSAAPVALASAAAEEEEEPPEDEEDTDESLVDSAASADDGDDEGNEEESADAAAVPVEEAPVAVEEEIARGDGGGEPGNGADGPVTTGVTAAELMRSAVFSLLNDTEVSAPQDLEALLFGNRAIDLSPAALTALDAFTDGLDGLRDDADAQLAFAQAVLGSGVAASAGLSVGYVAWLIRGGVLVSSVLSSLPAWRFIDPLPILASTGPKVAIVDHESLESIASAQALDPLSGGDAGQLGPDR